MMMARIEGYPRCISSEHAGQRKLGSACSGRHWRQHMPRQSWSAAFLPDFFDDEDRKKGIRQAFIVAGGWTSSGLQPS